MTAHAPTTRPGRPRQCKRVMDEDQRLVLAVQDRLLCNMRYVESCDDYYTRALELTDEQRNRLTRMKRDPLARRQDV